MTTPIVRDYEVERDLWTGALQSSTLWFSCPHCKTSLKTQYQGPKHVDTCAKCKRGFLVSPTRLFALMPDGPADKESILLSTPTVHDYEIMTGLWSNRAHRGSTLKFPCPHCKTGLKTKYQSPEHVDDCPECKGKFQISPATLIARIAISAAVPKGTSSPSLTPSESCVIHVEKNDAIGLLEDLREEFSLLEDVSTSEDSIASPHATMDENPVYEQIKKTEWYYISVTSDDAIGPFTPNELRELVENGTIGPETLIWSESLEDWVTANRIKGFRRIFSATVESPQTANAASEEFLSDWLKDDAAKTSPKAPDFSAPKPSPPLLSQRCIKCQQVFASASPVDMCLTCHAQSRLARQPVPSRATNQINSQRSEERTITTPDGEKRKRCPMCAELIQYEAKICRFCKSDLSSSRNAGTHLRAGSNANAAATSADDTYGYAIIALLVVVLALLWGWFPTLRLIDNPAGKLQIVMLLMWCGNGLLVYKDASNLGIEAKTNKSAASWALYAFLIPIVAIPHWLAYRQQLGGTRMFLWGLILSVVVAASIFHWSFTINNAVGAFQKQLQDLRNL